MPASTSTATPAHVAHSWTPAPVTAISGSGSATTEYGQAASYFVAGNNVDTIQHLMDMGCALRGANNNPEDNPPASKVIVQVQESGGAKATTGTGLAGVAPLSEGLNASSCDMCPQVKKVLHWIYLAHHVSFSY